ncbi:hypothetical protein FGG08_005337 [Glutinoglossum americanum]|uniref:DUF6589 domain-containing protein n=1 Tax=Glutinoglossum americanum TaxID=1670608 RepID=A0A9P8I3R8_9PEZI|nr:hypothetical protein FGG08_005337 [Glutinoglossum americanum]
MPATSINVLRNIFQQQYRLEDDAFAERLFLIYGDQKTVQRLRTIKKRREDAISRYDSFKWLLPIPALFHLKMNYLKMIITAHYRTEDGVIDQSSLRHSKEFWNRRKHKYAYEMLYFKRLISTPATTKPLQRAILANSLINLRGQPNSWFETDRLVELRNGKMKDILRTRHTSSITLDYLFEYCSLNSSFLKDLQRHVEHIFGVHVDSKHSTKSSQYDIVTLAAELQKYSMKFHPGRSTANEASDLNTRGVTRLSEAIRRFNVRESSASDLATIAEEEADTEEPIDSFYQFNEDTVSVFDLP